jgi:adenylate cyclase
MASTSVTRRLTAILSADVVAYSRLMEVDEADTLARLKSLRRTLIDPCIAAHNGRIVKLMGDCALVEFASVVDAVGCALDIQKQMSDAEPQVPADRRIVFRIGVNLGDIMVDGDDIYGEGVNVAARLQALAKPGGVAVSSTVREHIGGKIALDFEDFGEHTVKNIEKPVRVYMARLDGASPGIQPVGATTVGAKERPSIAILPFTNMSADASQDYFCDGITEDIITELARYRSLSVIARNSAFQFRGPAVDLPAVRRILGVRYIVEGSVRRAGPTVRVTAQLIDLATGSHLWADRYDRKIEDVFAVQDEVVHSIVSTLEGRLAAAGAAQVRAKPTGSWAAYDYFLQGRECSMRYRVTEADALLARAIELDPSYAQAYAWRASTLVAKYWKDDSQETLRQALICAEKALSLDDSDAWCHEAMGFVALHTRKHALAGMHFEKAMSINPNDVSIIGDYANWLSYMGRFDEAMRYLDLAMQRDPFPPSWIWEIRGTTLLLLQRHDEAISAFQKTPIENFFTHALLASAYAWAGQVDQARGEATLARDANPNLTVSGFAMPYAEEAHERYILDGLRMAGIPE